MKIIIMITFLVFFSLSVMAQRKNLEIQSSSIKGIVIFSTDSIISGATVIVANFTEDLIFTTLTDEEGMFKLQGLPPGKYSVKLLTKIEPPDKKDERSIKYITTKTIEIKLAPRQEVFLTLEAKRHIGGLISILGSGMMRNAGAAIGAAIGATIDNIPLGEVRKSSNNSQTKKSIAIEQNKHLPSESPEKKAEVFKLKFDNEMQLQEWLNSVAKNKKTVIVALPIMNRTSFFVVIKNLNSSKKGYILLKVDKALTDEDLFARISLHPDKIFIGIHYITDTSYCMVFQYDT